MKKTVFTVLASMSSIASALDAPPNMVPAGLVPGDKFYAVFVTTSKLSSPGAATSIAVDAHVNTDADSSSVNGTNDPSITWQAMYAHNDGTTKSTSLFSADTGAPIYNLDGVKVADNVTDMFDGTINSPINIAADGTSMVVTVGTGLTTSGAPTLNTFGMSFGTGISNGVSNLATSDWIDGNIITTGVPISVYAVSPILTVPGLAPTSTVKSVPASSALSLTLLGGLIGLAAYRNRRKLKKS